MEYNILKNLLQLLQSDELQIKTFADLLRFKQEYNIKNNKQLLEKAIYHKNLVKERVETNEIRTNNYV